MDNKKQKLLIEYLMSSADTFSLCQSIVLPEYFDPELRSAVKFIKNYYNEYNTTPDALQVEAESGVELQLRNISRDQIEYTTTEIETFCRRRAIERAVLKSPELISNGDYGTLEKIIRDAIMISLQRNLGLRYFEDPMVRLKRMMNESPVIPTGWPEVDELLFGGPSRKELLLVSANSGGGKSITLANLGMNWVEAGYNVLYISLELSEDVVAQRFDTMVTGISRKDWKGHISEIATTVQSYGQNKGVMDIIQMPSGTKASQIEAYLKEYYLHYNMMPDILILDYLDKMMPNEKVEAGDVWTKDKLVSEQLRDLGVKYNMLVATASQLNRDAVKASHHDHSHIAGGISKINESDVYWSIVMNEQMKAAGQISFTFQKTRNSDGVGKVVHLKWDNKYLRIRSQETGQDGLKFKKKETPSDLIDVPSTEGNQNLLGLMQSINT